MINFDNIEYLKTGNSRQKKAYTVLSKNLVIESLQEFDPILVGTIPINIDIENSDLDIICCWKDRNYFVESIIRLFAGKQGFSIKNDESQNCVIASFTIDQLKIEIFGQNIPVRMQMGYRHMLIEHHLLLEHGPIFREKIIELKKQGYKTEPAFALLLGLQENPYEALLKYESPQTAINSIIK